MGHLWGPLAAAIQAVLLPSITPASMESVLQAVELLPWCVCSISPFCSALQLCQGCRAARGATKSCWVEQGLSLSCWLMVPQAKKSLIFYVKLMRLLVISSELSPCKVWGGSFCYCWYFSHRVWHKSRTENEVGYPRLLTCFAKTGCNVLKRKCQALAFFNFLAIVDLYQILKTI